MSDSCSVDGGCSTCSFGQRLATLNEENGEEWPVVRVAITPPPPTPS